MNYIEVEEELRGTEVHDPPPVAAPWHVQLLFRQPQPAPVWRAARPPPRGVEASAEHLPVLRVGEARALRDWAPAQRQNPPPRDQHMRQEPPVDGGAWIHLRAENRYSPADPENDRPMPLVPHFQTYPEADISVAAIPVREPRVRRALVSPRPEAPIENVTQLPQLPRPLIPPRPEAQVEREPRLSRRIVFPQPEASTEREPRLSRPIIFPQPEAQVEREPLVRQPFVPPRPEVPRPLPHPEPNNPHPHLHPTPSNRIRKPLEGGCYICYEDFENPQDAVWCRVCGQNLHVDCFRAWTAGKRFEDVTCAFWYVFLFFPFSFFKPHGCVLG